MSLLALLLGCGGDGRTELTVLAASSLAESFAELERSFEAKHPGVDVVLSFGGSQALATQVRHGIRADVVASADASHLRSLASDGLVDGPRRFARNALVLVVPEGSERVTLRDLGSVGSLVVGGETVPVGRYTTELLDRAERSYGTPWRDGVEGRVVSREPNVRLVAAKVALGEADAAVVYRTDAVAFQGLRSVEMPASLAPQPAYFHAALADAVSPELADAWLAHVESSVGQAILVSHGFTGAR